MSSLIDGNYIDTSTQERYKPLDFEINPNKAAKAEVTPVLPLGHHVLIEIIPVQFKSAGGIIMSTEADAERERKGRDLGRILAFGPTAYKGFSGCECAADWGVKVGDSVELSGRYDGKFSSAKDYDESYKNLRYVNDSDIIGKLGDEIVEQLISKGK
jgi:co-chaperonin GroES (HSP10)